MSNNKKFSETVLDETEYNDLHEYGDFSDLIIEESKKDKISPQISRRGFISSVGLGLGALASAGTLGLGLSAQDAEAAIIVEETPSDRISHAYRVRIHNANRMRRTKVPKQTPNREEEDYPYIANFTKGLQHNALGEVDAVSYKKLLRAIKTATFDAFEKVPLAGAKNMKAPLSGVAFELESLDSHQYAMPPAPRINKPRNSAEAAELYWMALCRDVSFTDFASSMLISDAIADMSRFSNYGGPKIGGAINMDCIFRGHTDGDLVGPYLSQFLLKDIGYTALIVPQKIKTAVPGVDYLTDYSIWLFAQNGNAALIESLDPTVRYIRNGRDLARYVQHDYLFQAATNAALILLDMGVPFDLGNPYSSSSTQDGFATLGDIHLLSLIGEVATRALKAVWFQKWWVHRRMRPEEFGGRIHNHITGAATYPIDTEILNSSSLSQVFSQNGTYLLPQAYPQGTFLHPSYGSGHATVIGAAVTILKAWFEDETLITNPVVPAADGLSLVPYAGADAGAMTVGGELDKLAANIGLGRNWLGIHWRSDEIEGFKLGEAVAINFLKEMISTLRERVSFTFTRFNGRRIQLR